MARTQGSGGRDGVEAWYGKSEIWFCESEILGLTGLKLGFVRVEAWFCESEICE